VSGHPGLLAAAEEVRADAAQRDPWLTGLPLVGIGWATVELERAAAELDAALAGAGMPRPAWAPGPRDELLGASAWISREWWPGAPASGTAGPPAIALLEPNTEGRLAASLARSGEGVAVVYLAPASGDRPGGIEPARLGRSTPGPLGPGRILLARPAWGPHVIVLDRPPAPAARRPIP
jgi:hypothetical protein